MSRVGKQQIAIPDKTEVSVADGVITVKGPLGELTKPAHTAVEISIADGTVQVSPAEDTGLSRALWGTYASHVINMVHGVNTPYEKKLEIQGVGYRAAMQGTDLVLNVGFSHQVVMPVPKGLEVAVEKNIIIVKGIDKEQVGQFSANVRAKKKPEPYKGKGIRYQDEYVIRKQGKRAA